MASLPPGWTADYDGQRWFFTYGPTGQSQFQFPRPGDEFPDLLLCSAGGGAAVLPAVGLLPEERLESERQVRRLLNANGGRGESGSRSGNIGLVVDGEGGLREASNDGGTVCFESFAAVKFRGKRGLGSGREEGMKTVEQRGRCGGDEIGIQTTTGVDDGSGESSGEPVSVPAVIKGEHAQADSSPQGEPGSTATISIMSEPVLAVVETTAAALTTSHQGERKPATLTRPSPPELPMPDGRAVESAHTAPWVHSVGDISELYSESTALCEEEINPPPVELPGNEEGWNGQCAVPDTAVQSPVELPTYEAPGASSGKGSSSPALEPKCLAGDYTAISRAGRGEAPGAKGRGHDRASLPPQALRNSSQKTLDKTSLRERVNSAPDQEPSLGDTGQPVEKVGTERRDLTHFPSILRPGPRRSGQQRPPPPGVPAPVTNTAHATARVQLRQQPRGQHHEEQVEACPAVSQEEPARMPAMPLTPHPCEPQTTAPTTSPEAPPTSSVRQERLPDSVNFVIPIRHFSGSEPRPARDNAATGGDSPRYHVSASFASVRSLEERPVAGVQANGKSPGFAPERKTESWGLRAGQAVSAQLVGGRSAAGLVPEWSWGCVK